MKKIVLLATAVSAAATGQAAITWSWNGTPPADPYYTYITSAMNGACAEYNSELNITDNVQVDYNSGVPTAQTDGFLGVIEFGTMYNQRTAQHEMSHHFGTGTYWNWMNNSGKWGGAWGQALERSFDGSSAVEYCDGMHYWPYGLNYDSEWNSTSEARQPLMMAAMRQDMGFSNGAKSSPIANGTYKIINHYSGLALDVYNNSKSAGATVDQWPYNSGSNQKWKVTQAGNNQYQITSVLSGLALDDYGWAAEGASGAKVDTWTITGAANQRWWIQSSTSGGSWYKIINVYSGMAIDPGYTTANGASVLQYPDSFSNNTQEWSFQTP